jgi:hypothetical protein
VNKRTFGQAIGSHLGKTIYQSIQDENVTYIYDRIAQCETDGACPLDQLSKNELLIEPGLIYKQA